jgi:hypothetical protein
MACNFTIRITYKINLDREAGLFKGHYLELTADNALYEGIAGDANIFLYQRETANNELAPVWGVVISAGGSGYTTPPSVSFTGGGGTGAAGTATVLGGVVTGVTITNPGTGYASAPTVSFASISGTGAAGTAKLDRYGSYFTAVCSPADMEEILDTTEPQGEAPTPLKFRLNYVRAYFRSKIEATEALADIQADIGLLMSSFKQRCLHLSDPVVNTIGS